MSEGSILISTGEASGDAVGAALVKEFRAQSYRGDIFAIGTSRLRDAGANIVCDSRAWGAMGVVQSLRVGPKILKDYLRMKRWVKKNQPELVVAIDFGFFNVRFLKYAHNLGLKTGYFMPPGSWRKNKQGADIPAISDRIATPFAWSADMLRSLGGNVEWVGHPITQMSMNFRSDVRDLIAVMPGSRRQEIQHNMPAIAGAFNILARQIGDDLGGLKLQAVVAPTTSQAEILSAWRNVCRLPLQFSTEQSYATLSRARAGVICSGTATLESAVCGTPMVVVYKVDKLSEMQFRIFRPKYEYAALPSILLGRRVVPELIQYEATPEAIATRLRNLLEDSPERAAQLSDFLDIQKILGPEDAIVRTARLFLGML